MLSPGGGSNNHPTRRRFDCNAIMPMSHVSQIAMNHDERRLQRTHRLLTWPLLELGITTFHMDRFRGPKAGQTRAGQPWLQLAANCTEHDVRR